MAQVHILPPAPAVWSQVSGISSLSLVSFSDSFGEDSQYTNVTLQIPAKVCWTPVYTWRTTEENSSKLGYCRLISVFGDVIGQTFHFELNSHLQNEGAR